MRDEESRSNPSESDPRVFFEAERTFLAWIRTGLALMGFGFVVARVGPARPHSKLIERAGAAREKITADS